MTDFLLHLGAENSFGNVEPHTDWNDLMSSWATYIQNDYSTFEAYVEFFPGENIQLAFENGTQLDPVPWQANYNSPGPVGPLANGGDFYNYFVLGFYPASFDPNAPDPCASTTDGTGNSTSTDTATATTSSTPTSTDSSDTSSATSWPDTAYPKTADIYQPNLFPDGGGFVTGYFLKDISTAVLSMPTFQMSGNDTETFSSTVTNFIKASHEAGMQKILIDLQQNLGGDTLLAVDTYKNVGSQCDLSDGPS